MKSITLLLSLCACLGPCGLERPSLERDFVLPTDYAGWVVIEYGVEGGHTPSSTDGRDQVPVPKSGKIQLTTPYKSGVLNDRYTRSNGTPIRTLSGEKLTRSEEHEATRSTPFVCCGGTRTYEDVSAGKPKRTFDYFYVGKGPAGDAPTIP